jgi:hypothetical protein
MQFIKFVEAAAYFYIGAFLVLSLQYFDAVLGSRFGYEIGPEVGLDLAAIAHLIAFLPYYGAFVLIEYGLSRFNKAILGRQFLLPVSLATGAIVSYTFLYNLDFLFWLVYERNTGTIVLSVIAIELLFLLMNFAVAWRIINESTITKKQNRIYIFLVAAALVIITYGLQLLL